MNQFIKEEEKWRLYIDRDRQYQGKNAFENEPGYMKAMLEAHDYMLTTLEQRLTPQYIKTLRAKAINKVGALVSNVTEFRDKDSTAFFGITKNTSSIGGIKEFILNQYIEPKHTYNLEECLKNNYIIRGLYPGKGTVSPRGDVFNSWAQDRYRGYKITPKDIETLPEEERKIYEDASQNIIGLENIYEFASKQTIMDYIKTKIFLNKIIKNNLFDDLCKSIYAFPMGVIGFSFVADTLSLEEIESRVQAIINEYYKEISAAATSDEKLIAIVKLVQGLEQLHPFEDANCRTFCMLLLNRELIANHLEPTMVRDPNFFDLKSQSELVTLIKEGQQHLKQYQPDNQQPIQSVSELESTKQIYYKVGIEPIEEEPQSLNKPLPDNDLQKEIKKPEEQQSALSQLESRTNYDDLRENIRQECKQLLEQLENTAWGPNDHYLNEFIVEKNDMLMKDQELYSNYVKLNQEIKAALDAMRSPEMNAVKKEVDRLEKKTQNFFSQGNKRNANLIKQAVFEVPLLERNQVFSNQQNQNVQKVREALASEVYKGRDKVVTSFLNVQQSIETQIKIESQIENPPSESLKMK
ncbi:hypothetical protein EP47_01570 [Legionella norrlandica]|uniref:Uncharacterized protein n=1 Tax=Legionella norrlandica TaxID=1498499 RepID=A0A0A2T4V8_9GAMM|nr:Fic family protein [Legionella norrlandica]KGP62438.1 hypothetical protein EP47_01570 [Legionella norrlandica]